MGRRFERTRSSVAAVVREIRREDITFMAASIAYHSFVSMLPILVLLLLVASAFESEQITAAVYDMIRALFPSSGRQVVTDALQNATAGVRLSMVGIVVLLWGTSKIFRALDAAFAEIYDTERKLSLLDQFRDVLVVSVALATAAIGTVLI